MRPRPAAAVVEQLLQSMQTTVRSYHPEVGRTGTRFGELVGGTSFFPGGTGLWRGAALRGPMPAWFPVRPVMLVGHNFDSQRAYARSLARGGDVGGQFWTFLLQMLAAAGVAPEDCFFTNALMGLKPGSATGPMPRVPGYLEECEVFLAQQAAITQARCAVALGTNAAAVVRGLEMPSVTVKHPSSLIYVPGHLREEVLRQEGAKLAKLVESLAVPEVENSPIREN